MCQEIGGSQGDGKGKDTLINYLFVLHLTSICHTIKLTVPKFSPNIVVILE